MSEGEEGLVGDHSLPATNRLEKETFNEEEGGASVGRGDDLELWVSRKLHEALGRGVHCGRGGGGTKEEKNEVPI